VVAGRIDRASYRKFAAVDERTGPPINHADPDTESIEPPPINFLATSDRLYGRTRRAHAQRVRSLADEYLRTFVQSE